MLLENIEVQGVTGRESNLNVTSTDRKRSGDIDGLPFWFGFWRGYERTASVGWFNIA